MKKYRWNAKKCLGNMAAPAVMVAMGLLLGWIFAMWAMA